MTKKLFGNKRFCSLLITLMLPVILLCGGCSSAGLNLSRVTRYSSYYDDRIYNSYDNLDQNYILQGNKYYTDKIYPNEKQREKAYNLQTYLMDLSIKEDGLFYENNEVYHLVLRNVLLNNVGSIENNYDFSWHTEEEAAVFYTKIYNGVSLSFKYNEADQEAIEKISQVIEYVDKNFYPGFAKLADEWKNSAIGKESVRITGVYNNNAFMGCYIWYDNENQKIHATYTFDYGLSLNYARGYEELTDKLSKNQFLFTKFEMDNKIQKLTFRNAEMHNGTPAIQDIHRMKIDLYLQNNDIKKAAIIADVGAISAENKNAVYCTLEELGANSNEIENIIKKIEDKTILSSKLSKEGNINISADSSYTPYIIFEFWK